MTQLAGRPEVEHAPVEHALESERSVAEWAICDRDRLAADRIVDDFVPHEDWSG